MVPNAEQILLARVIRSGFVRLYGVVSILFALHLWAYEIELAIGTWQLFSRSTATVPSQYQQTLPALIWDSMSWTNLLLLAFGVVCFLFPRRLARLLVRFPTKPICPRCDYSLAEIERPHCPECGLRLTDAFLAEPSRSEPASRGEDPAQPNPTDTA